MKKLLIFIIILGSMVCSGQIPTQYAYVNDSCEAVLPDYRDMVIVRDNCRLPTIAQYPIPGDTIMENTTVTLTAIDGMGNSASLKIDVVLLDTISPLIQFDPEWQGYTDEEVGDMYKVLYAWVQDKGDVWNATAVGNETEIVLPDTTIIHVEDSMRYFRVVIPILDYRADEGYWQNTDLDLSAMFKPTIFN